MPDLDHAIWQRYRDLGLLVIGLHGDEDPILLADFLEQTGITFPVMHSQYTISDIAFPSDGYPFPRQVVVGRDRVVRSIRNDLDIDSLDSLIRGLLAD